MNIYNALGLNEYEISLIRSIPLLKDTVLESRAIQIARYFLLISEKFNIEQVNKLKVVPYSEKYTIVSVYFGDMTNAFPLLLTNKLLKGSSFDDEFEKELQTITNHYDSWLKLSKKGNKKIKVSQLLFKKSGGVMYKQYR